MSRSSASVNVADFLGGNFFSAADYYFDVTAGFLSTKCLVALLNLLVAPTLTRQQAITYQRSVLCRT
jgi:hypothetical protein